MYKGLILNVAMQAFMGNAEACVELVAQATHEAVAIYAQHGTRAPIDDATRYCEQAKGNAKRFAALRAGWAEVSAIVRTIKPGKSDAAGATDAAQRCADAFTLAAGAVLGATGVKVAVDPVKAGTRAVGIVAKLTAANLRRVLATNEGRDMLAAIARVQSEGTAKAAKAAKAATAKAATAKAAAPVAPVTVTA